MKIRELHAILSVDMPHYKKQIRVKILKKCRKLSSFKKRRRIFSRHVYGFDLVAIEILNKTLKRFVHLFLRMSKLLYFQSSVYIFCCNLLVL